MSSRRKRSRSRSSDRYGGDCNSRRRDHDDRSMTRNHRRSPERHGYRDDKHSGDSRSRRRDDYSPHRRSSPTSHHHRHRDENRIKKTDHEKRQEDRSENGDVMNDTLTSREKLQIKVTTSSFVTNSMDDVNGRSGEENKIKKMPLSLEELLEKKKKEEEALSKPKFLSKEERAKLALEKRQREVEEKRTKQELGRQSREMAQRKKLKAEDRFSSSSANSNTLRNKKKPPDGEVALTEEELKLIRERYVGKEKVKRHIRKMNENRYIFEWEDKEDTSQDINPLYSNRKHGLLFGRGKIAGVDEKSQKKSHSEFYESLLKERRNESELIRAKELLDIESKRERQLAFDERHWSEKPLEQMKERDWRIFKEDFNISTRGGNIPQPLRSWSEALIPESLKTIIGEIGYKEPTPIQRQAIPIGLGNRDIIGIAETGSGKTATFLIPMLVFIMDLPPITQENAVNGPYALVLAPTRELAQQIEQESKKFCSRLGYTCVSIVGGHSLEEQAFSLRHGAEIVIATPGRLKDCLDRRLLVLSQCTYVVMDEADRMVDMGFEADVNFILDALPVSNVKPDTEDAEDPDSLRRKLGIQRRYRQTVMFSATMPPAVERLAKKYLRRPAVVTIGTAGQAVDRIEQRVELLGDDNRKRNRLIEIINASEFEPPILIFANQKGRCELVSKFIEKTGYRTAILHGGKSQEQRESSLAAVKSGNKDILIATDVAGRGIDIKDVSLVINFDMAKTIEDYTHRIGRTGRAGKHGVAITFLANGDEPIFYDLKQMLIKSAVSKVPRELSMHEASQTRGVSKQTQ